MVAIDVYIVYNLIVRGTIMKTQNSGYQYKSAKYRTVYIS